MKEKPDAFDTIYSYSDGSGNAYTILNQHGIFIVNYDPVIKEYSSSGTYSGGDKWQKKINDVQYNFIIKILNDAINNKSIHQENREMGTGYIQLNQKNNIKKYIIKSNASELQKIETAFQKIKNS